MDARDKIVHPSVFALILANLVPLYGILFWGWDIFTLLFLYWLESAVIAFYSLFRIIYVFSIVSIIVVPFFIFHFGLFMVSHLFILNSFFNNGTELTLKMIIDMTMRVLPAAVALFVSHGVSFFKNFIKGGEYLSAGGLRTLMPYNRIIVMHLSILFGGALSALFDNPTWMLVVLVFLKIITDSAAHLREHAMIEGYRGKMPKITRGMIQRALKFSYQGKRRE